LAPDFVWAKIFPEFGRFRRKTVPADRSVSRAICFVMPEENKKQRFSIVVPTNRGIQNFQK
jgi:hypothetical protein